MDCYTDRSEQYYDYGRGQVPSDPAWGRPHCPDENPYPVAMAFVPWQRWQPTYDPERGLMEGTIFPDLNLDFHCGRCGQ